METLTSEKSAATGTRYRHFSPILVALCAGLVSGCASEAARKPSAIYAKADRYRRTGRLPEGLEVARTGFAAWRHKPAVSWHWRFRLMSAELALIQANIQDALPLLEDQVPENLPDHSRLASRWLNDRGYAAYRQDDLAKARELLGRAYDLARQQSFPDLLAQIGMIRGYTELGLKDMRQGEQEFRAATAAARASGDRYLLAAALGNMAYLFVQLYRYDEAMDWAHRSLEISQADGYDAVTDLALGNLGWCYYRLGDLEKAAHYYNEAEKLMARRGEHFNRQIVMANQGSLHFTMGDNQQALADYQRALAVAREFHFDSSIATLLDNIASTYVEMGDVSSAELYDEQAGQQKSHGDDKDLPVRLLLNAAGIALAKSDWPKARQLYEEALEAGTEDSDLQWTAHGGLAELYSREGDTAKAHREFAMAVSIVDESWSSLLNDQSKMTFPTRLTRFYRKYVDFLMERHLDEEALNFVESRRARLLSENMRTQPPKGGFRTLARQSNGVLLSYWLAPDHSYLWVTTPTEIQSFHLPGEGEIRPLVESYSESIQRSEDSPLGSRLYDLLVKPATALLPDGAHVVVVVDGCLHALNFETLKTPARHYWIENATIEVAPSLTLLSLDREAGDRNQSILLMGDPLPSDRSLPQLPYAGKEIADIREIYEGSGSVVKVNKDALPETYLSLDLEKFGLIHFAAHAVPNRDSPLDSAVVLSPGKDSAKLYARQVVNAHLTANLVTISACQSAGARTYDGEGLVGFAWAFLKAGAQHVVASLWDVSDQFTADFMKRFYARMRDGKTPAVALREVKLEFLQSGRQKQLPYHWAPFQLYVR